MKNARRLKMLVRESISASWRSSLVVNSLANMRVPKAMNSATEPSMDQVRNLCRQGGIGLHCPYAKEQAQQQKHAMRARHGGHQVAHGYALVAALGQGAGSQQKKSTPLPTPPSAKRICKWLYHGEIEVQQQQRTHEDDGPGKREQPTPGVHAAAPKIQKAPSDMPACTMSTPSTSGKCSRHNNPKMGTKPTPYIKAHICRPGMFVKTPYGQTAQLTSAISMAPKVISVGLHGAGLARTGGPAHHPPGWHKPRAQG